MGKEKLLLDAHFETDNFVDDLRKRVGKPTTIPKSLLISILNNIWQMVGNTRFDYEDKDINDFAQMTFNSRDNGSRIFLLDLFPWLLNILPTVVLNKIFKFQSVNELTEKIEEYFKKAINQHKKDLNKGIVKDYIDAYLIEMERFKDDPESFFSICNLYPTVDDLLVSLVDLFVGATETTGHSIHWAIVYLAAFPNVQEKLQGEIDRVLPRGTQFFMKDKTSLPYTEAFIHEVFRMSSVAVSPTRTAIADTNIGPYVIPKGAWIMGRLISIHHDPKYWDSPHEFRPERFLNADGNFEVPVKGFAPFGSGRRLCIGETIARMHLFVYITKLVQNFTFECPPGEKITLEDVGSPFIYIPKESQKFLIKSR
ncbi:cytochrome P450 2L1 [Armadillidium vulgare]|nr:cytochrome P450 2L1 [Armadillidium vulgare]